MKMFRALIISVSVLDQFIYYVKQEQGCNAATTIFRKAKEYIFKSLPHQQFFRCSFTL
jgi:hypothetical protein